MYLLYIDESGDPGPKGVGDHFVLTGIIVHESRWQECFRLIKDLRITLREQYEIRRNQELHGNKNIAGRGALWGRRWTVQERVRLFQLVVETVTQMPGVRTVNVCVCKTASHFHDKRGHHVHEAAWTLMLQRFHNFIEHQTRASIAECGMVIHDSGHEVEIRKLMRKLRVFNPVPSRFGGGARNIPLVTLIEDPVPRDSYHAQFIQMCDYLAYSLLRREEPMDKYPELSAVFQITAPVILGEASRSDPEGIVRFPRG
jgi:hypothetical protein